MTLPAIPQHPNLLNVALDNGLMARVLRHGWPKDMVELRLVLRAGSVLEDDDQQGVAHVLEHLAFRGTTRFPDDALVRKLGEYGSRFGAHLNATTSFETTIYKLQLPSTALMLGLEILREWAGELTLDGGAVEGERLVVLEEWRRGRGARARARDILHPLFFGGSRYAVRLPIGTESSIQGFAPEAVHRFYRDWYRPDLMGVLVVGDVDIDTTMATIHDLFSDLQAPNTARPRAATEISIPSAIRCTTLTDPETVHTEVALQVQIPCTEGDTERDYISQHLLPGLVQRILNERFSELSRTENPPFIYASATGHRVSPDLIHHAVAARIYGDQITTGTVALSHAVERLRQGELDRSALDRAARRMIRDLKHLEVEDARLPSARLINELVRHHNVGEPMPGAAVERRIAERLVSDIDLDLVRTACANWFPENGRVLTIVGPAKSELPNREAALSMLDTPLPPRASTSDEQQPRRLIAPAAGSGEISDTRSWPTLDLTRWTLSNGARIWLKPTHHKSDEIQLYAQVSGGLSMADDATYVAARTALGISQRSGLGDHDATTLSRFLAGRTVGIRAIMQEHWHGARGSSNGANFDTLMELLALQITAPRFDLTAFENERASREASLKNRKADPAAVFRGKFKRRLWRNHPRIKPWKSSDLKHMNLSTSSDFYKTAMAGLAQGDVLLVGSFDLNEVEETICQRIGTLPPAAQATHWMDRNRRAISGPERLLVERGQTPRATVRIRFGGDYADSPESRYAIRSMSAVLNLMLRAELRESRGGTYNVSVKTSTVQRPVRFWAMTIQFDCEPARSDALIQAALDTVDRLCDGDIPPHFVDEVRAQHARGHEQSVVKNGFWVNALALAIRRQEDPIEITRHKARINALDLAGVIDTAQARLTKPPQLIGVLQPEAQTT